MAWLWEKIKSAARWLGRKIVAGLRWARGLITGAPAVTESVVVPQQLAPAAVESVSLLRAFAQDEHKKVAGDVSEGKSASMSPSSSAPAALDSVAMASSEIRSSSYLLHHHFQPITESGKLLKAVEYADYVQVQQLIAKSPALMFEPVNFRFRNGRMECISPLKYAFYVYDTYMWGLFYQIIKAQPAARQTFLAQANEQTTHINLDPLFEAYQEYQRQFVRWENAEITNQALDAAWLTFGQVQKAQLPVHLLKEFSREEDSWRDTCAFDVRVMPAPMNGSLYHGSKGELRSLTSLLQDPDWGRPFSFVRGLWQKPSILSNCRRRWSIHRHHDLETFRRLFEIRKRDLAEQIALMKRGPDKALEHKSQSSSSSSASRATP